MRPAAGGGCMSPQPEQELAAAVRALDDARQQLKATQALLETERAARSLAEHVNAMKDEFLAIVSHELRSSLSAIGGWAHLLRHGASQEDFDKGLEVIEQSVRVQTKLVEDLLDISRIASGRLRLEVQPVEPREIIDAAVEAVRPAADAKGVGIRKVLDLAAGPVAGDPSRLQQVMVNLLSNAVKFTPEQGCVEVSLQRKAGDAEISVTDSGIGIPPDFLPYVFDRFRQADIPMNRRFGGLGLGLAIVKHLVELHGGSVAAESPGEGHGATFRVRLPIALECAEAAPDRPAASPGAMPVAAGDTRPAASAAEPSV